MTFVSDFPISTSLAMALIFVGFVAMVALFSVFGYRFTERKGSRVLSGFLSGIGLVGSVALVITIFALPNVLTRDAREALQVQASEVYGIDLPYGAAAALLDGGGHRYSLYDLEHHADAAAGVIERQGTAEWVTSDGGTATAQLAWDGEQWILVQAELEELTELERR